MKDKLKELSEKLTAKMKYKSNHDALTVRMADVPGLYSILVETAKKNQTTVGRLVKMLLVEALQARQNQKK